MKSRCTSFTAKSLRSNVNTQNEELIADDPREVDRLAAAGLSNIVFLFALTERAIQDGPEKANRCSNTVVSVLLVEYSKKTLSMTEVRCKVLAPLEGSRIE